MLYSENHSKLEHEMGGSNMRYTLDLFIVSIGIIEFFQIGINLDISCILIYFSICMTCTSKYINFNWYRLFIHTYLKHNESTKVYA